MYFYFSKTNSSYEVAYGQLCRPRNGVGGHMSGLQNALAMCIHFAVT